MMANKTANSARNRMRRKTDLGRQESRRGASTAQGKHAFADRMMARLLAEANASAERTSTTDRTFSSSRDHSSHIARRSAYIAWAALERGCPDQCCNRLLGELIPFELRIAPRSSKPPRAERCRNDPASHEAQEQ